LKFNSSKNDQVTIPHSDLLDCKGSLTLEVWVYIEKVSTGYFIAKKQAFALAIKRQNVIVALNNSDPGWVWKNTKHELPLQVWTHVAVTYSEKQGQAMVYVNGQEVKIFSDMVGPLQPTKNELYFGLHLQEQSISGMISDVRIWKKVMTPEQIQQESTTRETARNRLKNAEGLVAWWPLDGGYGIDIKDITENQLHGTLSGTEWVRSGRGIMNPCCSRLDMDLKTMFNNPIGSDIRIRASDSVPDCFFFGHKIILCQRSEVFKAMLLGSHKEGCSSIITLNDISMNVLGQLLEFMYTDRVEMSGDTVLELFSAADKYHLDHLKYKCEIFMQENMCLDNICTILETADCHQATLLRAVSIRWILSNFWAVLTSGHYLNLPRKLMAEVNHAASQEFNQRNEPPIKRRKHNCDVYDLNENEILYLDF